MSRKIVGMELDAEKKEYIIHEQRGNGSVYMYTLQMSDERLDAFHKLFGETINKALEDYNGY